MRAIKWLVLYGFLAVPVLVALLWLDHNRQTTLPAPTGPLEVGRAIYDWVDDKTTEAHGKRELLVWMWYPADRNQAPWWTTTCPLPCELRLRR